MGVYHDKINQYGNKEIARYLLIEQCGVILATIDKEERLFKVAYDYLFNGCQKREDYLYLLAPVFNHDYDYWCREELEKWQIKKWLKKLVM